MKKKVFDAICYIPKFEQDSYGVVTKKISFEIALYLGMEEVTRPYIPTLNDGVAIPMIDKETLFGSVVEYAHDNKGWGSYIYYSPIGGRFNSGKSIAKGTLAVFLNTVNTYLYNIFSESDRQEGLQRWKKIFETVLRCGLKKRRHLLSTNQEFALHDTGYLIDTKTKQFIFSLDDFIFDTDVSMGGALSCMSCAEYIGRELRYDFDEMVLDEYDQFAAYAGGPLLEQGIALYATHAIEIFELQKRELEKWFANGILKDEYRVATN